MDNFNINDRQPIIPLSLEDIDISRSKEFIFDYDNNIAYIKLSNGSLFNITESDTSLEHVKRYLEDNQDIILNVTIKSKDSEEYRTIQENVDYIYMLIQEFSNKKFNYAGSTTDGGNANSASKVSHSIKFIKPDNSETTFDGSENVNIDLTKLNLFKKSGGRIDGPMKPMQKFLLGNGISYGSKLPNTGVEGQIFILLDENI